MTAEQFKARTKAFALDVFCFCTSFSRPKEMMQVRSQLQRCSTSVAANYRAACRAKSHADFIAKLGIVEEEADEAAFWLEFITALNQRQSLNLEVQKLQELDRLWNEASQLLAMTIASKKTARGN